jgi:hypothetical protein
VCCKDLWCLETVYPGEPEKVQLLKAGIGNLEISWNPVPTGKIKFCFVFYKISIL